MAAIPFVVMFVLFFAGTPIAFSLMAATALFFWLSDQSMLGLAHRTVVGSESFVLTAIPFFILAALIMNTGGITRRIIRFADSLIGSMPGSTAQVSTVASMINSGITGSSLADCAGIGGVLIPEMIARKYSRPFTAAVIAAASTIGPVIPPSIPFVIYGSIAGVSVGRLFLAGAVPGILIGLALMISTHVIAVRRGYERGPRPTLRGVAAGFRQGILALIMPALILGGIGFGVFTPTEAAAVACAYAVLVTALIYWELKPNQLGQVIADTISMSIPPLIIIVAASPFSTMLAWQQLPQQAAKAILDLSQDGRTVLLLLNLAFFLLGFVTDCFPIFYIVTPLLLPVALAAHIDLVHLGVLITINALLGNLTPPFGLLMFLSCNIAGCTIPQFAREAWPYILSIGTVLLILTWFPEIVLWLPNLVMGPS
jgi:C4-dicarboxylate transporter DctM subunit